MACRMIAVLAAHTPTSSNEEAARMRRHRLLRPTVDGVVADVDAPPGPLNDVCGSRAR
jgi:hypothetical protein